MPSSLPPRPSRAATAVAVAAMHLLIGGAAWQLGGWPDRSTPPPAGTPLAVRLLVAEPAQRIAVPAVVRAAAATLTPKIHGSTATREPQAITLPPEPATAPATPLPLEPAATPAPTPAPLNLALPRAASAPERGRHPGLDDARANSARATLESRIAGATGGDERWAEERLDDDRVRFHRGGSCVEVHRSRDAQLDPFNQSSRPTPRQNRPC